jgi:hypothetical protein
MDWVEAMSWRGNEWTVEEANADLDRVRATVRKIQALVTDRRLQAGQGGSAGRAAASSGNGRGNGHRPSLEAAELQAAVDELTRDGILIRNVDNGLVDFPARSPSGRPYWLCWLVDEPEIAWWHWPETGFAGRRRLADPPE